jgi:flagellar biosynthesis protein FlhB
MVIPTSTPPAQIQVANQQQCTYSVKVNYETFKCYSEDEYNTMEATKKDNLEASNKVAWDYIRNNWWKLILGIIGFFITIFIFDYIYTHIDFKRHPERYKLDFFGYPVKKDWWEF